MTYGYYGAKGSRKQSKTKTLEVRRILASLAMTAGLLVYPFSVGEAATEIVRKEGVTGPQITHPENNNNVYNIDPEGSSGNFAYNRFEKFNLDSGHIANLNFKEAAALANLVNNQVSINGIVNAVKNGKIDGHLLFLSPNGIAVGASGVINAGQFTGIVPTQTAFDKLYNSSNPATDITLDTVQNLNAYANDKAIDISGKINTHSGVMLGAGIININDGAKIQSTKNLDFKDLVNIQNGANADLGELTKVEGSGGEIVLAAKQVSDVKDTKVTKDENGQDKTEANAIRWKDRSTDLNAAVNIGKDKTDQGVEITSSDGAVKITAESSSTYEDSTPMTLTDTLKKVIFGQGETIIDGLVDKLAKKEAGANKYVFVNYSNKKNKASVNVGANSAITGNSIDIEAKSTLEIKQSVAVPASGKDSEGNTVSNDSVLPVAAVTVSRVYNNADVVIDGNLTATGADATTGSGIKIAANADTKVDISATAAGGEKTSAAVGVAVLTGDTKSKVTVKEGATPLTAAQGKVSIEAVTGSDINVNVGAVGAQSYVVSNVGVANYDNSAEVVLNRSITAGAVDINAENKITGLKMTVDNTVKTSTGSETGKDTADTSATDEADISAEQGNTGTEKSEDEKESEQKSVDPTQLIKDAFVDTNDDKTKDAAGSDGKGGIQDVKDKLEGTNEGGDNEKKNSAFGLGAAVGVVSNTNNANVTIGKNVVITAAKPAAGDTTPASGTPAEGGTQTGDDSQQTGEGTTPTTPPAPDGSVNISAKTLMTATTTNEDALQFTVKNSLAKAKVEIGAAVLVSNVKNNATVLMDSDDTNHATITSNGAVSLNAAAGMGKYPAPPEKEDGGDGDSGSGTDAGNGQNAGSGTDTGTGQTTNPETGNGTGQNAGGESGNAGTATNTGSDTNTNPPADGGDDDTDAEEKTSVLKYTVSAEGTSEEETPGTFALSGSVGVNTLKNNAIVMLGQQSQVTGSEVKLASDAATSAEGTYGAKDSNTKVGIGATVGIQNIRGNSLVMVGKGVNLTGEESLEVSANNELDAKNTAQNSGKGDSVGISGMVALSYGDSNSIVAIDDEAAITAGFTTITSTNSTNIDNSARTESTGTEGAKAFGIGVGIINYDINSIAMVGDNGSGLTAPTVVDAKNPTDTEKAAQKIYEDAKLARDVAGSTLAGKLGDKTAVNEKYVPVAKGTITTGGLVAAAVTTGMIMNDAKANANAAPKEKDDDDSSGAEGDDGENKPQDSEKWTKWSKQGTEGSGDAKKNAQNMENDNLQSQNESAAPSASQAGQEAGQAANPDQGSSSDDDSEDGEAAPTPGSPGASIGVEGSVALTFLGGRTDAVLDNVTVKNGTEDDPAPVLAASLSATDFLGSITLGGTGVKNKVDYGESTKVGIGATFAMNSSKRDVDSLIRNSELPMALMVSNSATKIGIEVAAGMGTSTGDGHGVNVNGAGVVYYNKAKQDVHALMINTNVMGASVSNEATSTDFQIAGGLSGIKGSGESTTVGVGGAVAISKLENDLKSGIIGGEYTVFSSVDVTAEKGTTQINGALAGTKGGYGFEGAFAYGSVKNTTRAYIEDATVTSLGDVNVKAGEVPVVKTDAQKNEEKTKIDNKIDTSIGADPNKIKNIKKSDGSNTDNSGSTDTNPTTYTDFDSATKDKAKEQLKKQAGDALDKEAAQQASNKNILEGAGLDTTGASYLDTKSARSSLDELDIKDADGNKFDEGKAAEDAAQDEDDAKSDLGQNHSITITAAMGGGWNDGVGAGAGIAYNYVKNDIAADIKGATITANTVNGEAATDALIVSVGAGIAVGGKTFNGAGSGSWNDLKNDTKVNFEKNTITGKSISEQALNTSSIINIAGEVAGGKGMSMGLSLAYNSLNNTTGTYLKDNKLTLLSDGDGAVRLATDNTGKALAVASAVNVNITQSYVGATGTVAINRGVNHTESVIDNADNIIYGVKTLSVTASDLVKKTTVAGGISVGGKKVGVGGAVAYTSVGSSGNKERLRAEVNHANITTTADGTITVSTTDSKTVKKGDKTELELSRIISVGAGFGVQWGKNFFNLQGGAAVSDIYKDSRASLNNTIINEGNTDNHPAISVTADTRSKVNTVGAGGTVDIGTTVRGTAGVAINRMYHDTTAEMATTGDATTTVNAGRTEVRAVGDGDIHSVGVGGTVGVNGQASFGGSGGYNYIGNNVNAIIQNQNLTANNNVGVVAQSDERLYNFVGGFAIAANAKVGLGAAVGINKITGSTNALVSGGSVSAADTDTDADKIKVTRPSDAKLFTTQSLDLTTDRTKLSESRTESGKTGIVVDSSATHTLISQLSSGGVAASASVGISLDGTVNLNTIEGETTAKVQDAALNPGGNASASNINVNAIDYTNIGSFTGTPAIGAGAPLGLSIGVSANWETLDRTTAAEISSTSGKKNVFAKDLTVDAIAKHGSSALSFAAAAGGGKVGISSGDSIVRRKYNNTISALLSNVNATFDGEAEIKADHLANSHMQNVSASLAAGMIGVAVGAGVSVIDDTSTVKAEVADSELKAKERTDGKNISVLATNENNWKNTLVTASASVAIGAGLAANVGINNTTGETAALVTNSTLEAYNVDVKAADKLTAKSIGGVGALGVGGVGVSVALNNINSSVSSHVTGGSVTAANDINVTAEEDRDFNSEVTGVAVGGIGVGVNVAITSINKGITDAQLSGATDENGKSMGTDEGTKKEIDVHLNGTSVDGKTYGGVNGAKGSLASGTGAFFGLNAEAKSDLEKAKEMSVSLSSATYKEGTPDTRKQGVHTEVSGETLTAAGNVNVKATDANHIFEKNLEVTVGGGISATVADNIIHTNYDTDVTMNRANITGKNVTIEARQTQKGNGSEIEVKAGTGAIGIGVGVGYAGIVNKGSTDVNITGSTIKSTEGDVTVNALDESKHKANILNVGVSSVNVTTTFASVENYSNVGITLNDTKDDANNIISTNISAAKSIAIDAKKANALEAHTQGVGVGGVNVAVNHATIEDGKKDENGKIISGNVTAKITGTNGTFTANSFHLGATNDTTAKLSAGSTAVSVLGVSRMRGKGVMNMGADVSVAGGRFNAGIVEFASTLGNANGRTLEGNVKGHNISAVAVAPDVVALTTEAAGTVNVANSTFGENTNLILDNESYVDRKAYIYSVTAGAVAVGNTSADIFGKETLNTTLTGGTATNPNKLNTLTVATYGENKGKAFADAGGGSLVGYIGAHVRNDSINNVTSTLGGQWETTGDVWLVAAQKDETRLTASEGHGGIAGVGGTSVDNYITTNTNADVADGTVITADRTHIGTANAITTGAYDDTNEKGATDAQTFTMKDHFGGVISGNRLRSLIDVVENGTVTIGSNAKITTNHLQEYIAASENNLTNLVEAKGGGAIAVTDAVSEFILDIHNNVNVESGAILSNEKAASTEDITIAAYDNLTMKSQVDGTVYAGVISPIVTKNIVVTDRTSDVTVAGTIESGSNVGLYAGADEKGTLSNLKADLKSGAYNYSVISITTPRVKYNKNDDDKDIGKDMGTVNVSGMVRSNKDINVIASAGKERISKDQSLWNWALGGSSTNKTFLTSDAVTADEALPKTSTVNVTGSLIAGTADAINVNIKGSVADGLEYAYISKDGNSYTYNPDGPNTEINLTNQRVLAGIKEGTFDYANTLGERLQKLNELIAAYDGNNNANGGAEVMAAYIAERTRIQDEMVRLGLTENDKNGNIVYSNSGRPVYYVEIPDLSTGGGNINVTANDLIGTGNLHANSAPGVTITNNSDAYLRLNNIIMGEQGGKITYNGFDNVIPPGASEGNPVINRTNVSKTGASFREIYGVGDKNTELADLTVKNDPTVSLESTITLTEEKRQQLKQEVENAANIELADENLTQADKDRILANKNDLLNEIDRHESFTYKAMPNVEVNGKISNFYGQVEINNTKGDIRINGGTQERPTGVFGNSVKLVASQGTIAQDYREGIVNISGDPEKYLDSYTSYTNNDLITAAENNMDFYEVTLFEGIPFFERKIMVRKPGTNLSGNATTTYERPASSIEATGYIAGRDVYVSASNINVNGLIQSGYKNYTATVTETQLAEAQKRPASRAAVVQNRTMYKVNDGGAQWNSTEKVFDYVPQVYWDPSTDKLVVEDIDTQGGKIYLTGKIASTGDGRILAADGAADITVTNETALDMNVGNVLNNQREGVITIADTANDTWTEYKRGQTRSITGYANYLKAHAKDGDPYATASVTTDTDKVLSMDSTLTYTPKANQTYNWTKGKTVEETKEYLHHKRYGLWGAVETKDATALRSEAKVVRQAEPREYGLPEGAVIQQDSTTGLAGNTLRLDTTSNQLEHWQSEPERWLEKTGFLGWFRNYYTRWTEGTKTLKTYSYSISASEPISIGLIGDATGSINIASTNANGGSINLTGNVANSHNAAPLTVNSAAGGIFQNDNTTLKSEIVNLSAKNDISNIHIASIGEVTGQDAEGKAIVTDNIQLNAVSTGKGDIDITAVGGFLNDQPLPGNVTIVALKSQDGDTAFSSNAALGDVTLTANGNIIQSGSGTTVEGRGITLTSKNGGIGTAGQAIQIAGSDLVYSTDRYGAQVNASAKDSIYLTEATAGGDMRVGKIESREGDVNLTVLDGGFIDALPKEDKSGSNDSVDEMVHRWIDAGLIDGEKDTNGNYTYKGAYIEGLEKARDEYRANVEAAYDIETVYASTDYQDYKARTGSYANKTDEEIAAKLEADGHQKYADYAKYETAAAYRTAHKIDWATQYNNEKTVVEAVYASADYKAYIAGTGVYAGMTAEQKSAKLAADGHQNYVVYAKYGTAEAYLKDTAAYKYSQYADANAYLDADATYTDLKDKADHPTFEWTKDMMLYAVSDKMVNPEGGGSVQTEQAANVLGVNVKLNAAKGVGTFADESETITGEQLTGSDAVTYMKQLLNVGASDVKVEKTVDEDGATRVKSFTITRNMPLGVFLKEKDSQESGAQETGALNVQAGGDVFVAGRTETVGNDVHSVINVGAIDAKSGDKTYDVRLHSAKGIYNAKTVNDTNITGRNLILTGGEESIGEAYKPLTVSLTGDITEARANKNVFIKNMNDADFLRLGAMSAGDTISLNSHKGFLMSSANSDIAVSYINAGKTLQFVADETTGIVGNADHAIRILNDRAPVDITAGTAYIKGVGNTDIRNGTLVLGTINTTNEFVAESEGSLSVGQEEEKDSAGNVVKPAVEGKINSGGNVTLSAADKLTLDGAVKAGNQTDAKKVLTLKAVNGDITQTAKGAITADAVNTFNGKSLLLENANNQFNSITVDGIETESGKAIDGNVRIIDNSDALVVAVKRDVTGDISVENLRENGALTNSGNLTATGNIELEAKGDLTQAAGTTLDAGKDVKLTSTNGALAANGNIKAQENIELKSDGDLTQAADSTLNAGKDVNLTSTNGALAANGNIKAQENIILKAKGDLTQAADSTLDAGKDVNLTSTNGALTANGNIKAQENIDLKAKGDLTQAAGSTLDARMNVEMTSTNGNLTQAANTEIKAGQNVTQTAQNGALVNDGKIVSLDGGITLTAKGDLTQGAKLSADKDIKVTSENGALANNNSIISGNGNIVLKAEKDLTQGLKGILAANNREKEVQLTSVNGGITQQATEEESAGIQAKKVTVVSKNSVDLWGVNNYFDAITVQSSVANAPIQGSVSIFDCADNMELSILPVVNGNIKVENRESAGAIQVTSELNANGNGADAKGDITLQSKGNIVTERKLTAANDVTATSTDGAMTIGGDVSASNNITLQSKEAMQTTGKLTAADDVNLTSTSGDVTIGGDVTTGTQEPKFEDLNNDGIPEVQEPYNALVIHAGGAIQEAEGVKIATPVVETYSAKGVSMESKNNTFEFFLADALGDNTIINGSVKAVTSYAGGEDQTFTAGVGVSVVGDVEFTNLHQDGHLGLLMLHPERDISVLEGNGAEGNLVLKASQDVGLLGDATAAHDIVIDSTNGSFYGIGKSLTAGHDVNVSVGDAVYYIGGTNNDGTGKALYAGHDIVIETKNSASEDAGIYIGALPDNINLMDVMNGTASVEEAPTVLMAVNNAIFNVNGNGDIDLKGNVMAKDGEVAATISGKGDITVGNEEGVAETTIMAQKDVTLKTEEGNIKVSKGIQSTEESVSVQTGKGDITVGRDNVVDGKTITAKKDVSVGTDLGTIYIQGETSTETGDITMKAGKNNYKEGSDGGNFVIRDDGQVNSGGGVGLYGRNGDIHITDDISAKKGLTASITEQGNVYFDTNVSVTNDVNITTEKGDIEVGHTVNAETGTVSLQTGKGDISIGADVTAGNDVKMKVNTGDVTVGDGVTGDDAGSSGQGNVVAKNGDVTVDISGKGNVSITKSVDSQNGSVSVKTKEGNINIGSANVKDDKTVTAKENVNVETDLGTIYILGMTSTEKGDITMKAGKDSYQADEGSGEDLVQNGNFIIKDDGKVNAGGAVNLKGRNGDIHITEAIEAKKGITTSITEKGNVYFDREVNVKDDVNITTEDGSIAIGKTVTSTEGNVNLQTGTGSILIGEDVTAEKDVTIATKKGSVIVGDTDTGRAGNVLSKKGDVSIQTGEGIVGIVKSVKAQEGSIDIQVGTGGVAIGDNGPGVETVTAYKNIDVAVDLGRIEINGKTSTKKGDISMSAAESEYVPGGQNIIIAQNGELDSGRDARLTGRNGDLHVTDAVKAVRNLNAKVLDEGDIVYDKTVNVNGDVTAKTDKGSISVAKEVTGNLVDLDTGKGNITVSGDIRSNTDVTMHTGTGDISVKNVNAQGNTTISDTGRGNVNGKNIVSGGTTHVSLTKGDLFLNLAEGKAVVLRMEDNTKASKVGTVLADASGGAGPDVELTGNYIPIGTLAAKNGNTVFEVTAMGANNQKLISGEITVGSLRSRTNTHMPTLWANRGNIHVDEGDLAIDDVLAVDKIHLENKLTDLAIFGRTPTRDGEQLYYWNNLEMANSKTRPFMLYANGKVRTHRAVLIDAGRYYGKLYGDNLSVVDMMRERLTNEHGQYTFDRTWYTKPGEILKEKVLFGMDTVDEDIRRHNASSGQLM
ncbi:MAG: hypothetical protein J5923_04925 [Acidaminococcaceae bacterium]|nr:hypothetical protein [Acidaminococcaceae bacterium]